MIGLSFEGVIGRGGFGEVVKAKDSSGREYAVKKFIPDFSAGVGDHWESFRWEKKILDYLRSCDPHENLVSYQGVCETELQKSLVFELEEGSLEDVDVISFGQAREWLLQLGSALSFLHNVAGIVHGDIKPGNILISHHAKILKIADFGLSFFEEEGPVYSLVQTRNYRAPEVILEHELTSAIDVWSVGIVITELLAKETAEQEMLFLLEDLSEEDQRVYLPPICRNQINLNHLDHVNQENKIRKKARLEGLLLVLQEKSCGGLSEEMIRKSTSFSALKALNVRFYLQRMQCVERCLVDQRNLNDFILSISLEDGDKFRLNQMQELIQKMLKMNPADRIKAAEIAYDPFMQKIDDRGVKRVLAEAEDLIKTPRLASDDDF